MRSFKPARADFNYQPHVIDEVTHLRTRRAFGELLARSGDVARWVEHKRGRVELYEPSEDSALSVADRAYLEARGFRMLARCTEWAQSMFGEIASNFEIWVDPTSTIQAHVIAGTWGQAGPMKDIESLGGSRGSVFFWTNFADGTALLMLPDDAVTASFQSNVRDAMSGTQDVVTDFVRFEARLAEHLELGREPLVCPDAETYLDHDELHGRFQRARNGAVQTLKTQLGMRLFPALLMVAAIVVLTMLGIDVGTAWWLAAGWLSASLIRFVIQIARRRYPRRPEPVFGTKDVSGPAFIPFG